MAEQLQKAPKKGILKNSTSFDKNERKSSLKETKWDEMNIMATFHPADKDYGHMKIEEPKTPYNYACPEDADAVDGGVNSDELAQKIRLVAEQPPKVMDNVQEEEDEDMESLTEEEREARRKFEQKRKTHYNEFYAVKLARQLMAQDEELAEEGEGAGPSSAPDASSSSSASGARAAEDGCSAETGS